MCATLEQNIKIQVKAKLTQQPIDLITALRQELTATWIKEDHKRSKPNGNEERIKSCVQVTRDCPRRYVATAREHATGFG